MYTDIKSEIGNKVNDIKQQLLNDITKTLTEKLLTTLHKDIRDIS